MESFFQTHESRCVSACYRFLKHSRGDKLWYLPGPEAVLLYTRRTLFPTLGPDGAVLFGSAGSHLPGGFWNCQGVSPLHAVQGLSRDLDILEPVLAARGLSPSAPIEYDLLALEAEDAVRRYENSAANPEQGPDHSGNGLVIRQPGIGDIDGLFPLQASYETEEVLPPGAVFNPAASRVNLKQLVENHLVLAAELKGHLVGKININAESFTRYQIGGVYVEPACRGQGIAEKMTAELIRRLLHRGKAFTLFVKKKNTAARRVYDRTGFIKLDDYRISYYI